MPTKPNDDAPKGAATNPSKAPAISDDTPGDLTVYIKSPAGAVGSCTVQQYRDLYQHKGWEPASLAEYQEHEAKLRAERRQIRRRPDLLYPTDGVNAAQVLTSRTASTPKES